MNPRWGSRAALETSTEEEVSAAVFSALRRAFGESTVQALRYHISLKVDDVNRAIFDSPERFEAMLAGIMGDATPMVLSIINGGLARQFGLEGFYEPAGRGTLAEIIEDIGRKHG